MRDQLTLGTCLCVVIHHSEHQVSICQCYINSAWWCSFLSTDWVQKVCTASHKTVAERVFMRPLHQICKIQAAICSTRVHFLSIIRTNAILPTHARACESPVVWMYRQFESRSHSWTVLLPPFVVCVWSVQITFVKQDIYDYISIHVGVWHVLKSIVKIAHNTQL